jgi:hypothetical protein
MPEHPAKPETAAAVPTVSSAAPAQKRCFVISPIGAPGSDVRGHADDVFEYIIAPVMKKKNYVVERGDHMARPGRISDQMYDRILKDDLLIAVLTFQNPNVYYELAIAHAAARPLIIMCETSQALPFDIKDQRVIFYDLRPRSLIEGVYKRELARAVEQIEQGEVELEVPFRPNLSPLGGLGESFKVFDRFVAAVAAGSVPFRIIEEAKDFLWLAGISLKQLGSYPDVRPTIEKLVKGGTETRILIMHEDNPVLRSMLNEENDYNDVRSQIIESFAMWKDMGRRAKRLSVRKLRRGIIYQQLFMSESRMLYTPYNMAVTTQYSPTIHTDEDSDLYRAQAYEFAALWKIAGLDQDVASRGKPARPPATKRRRR